MNDQAKTSATIASGERVELEFRADYLVSVSDRYGKTDAFVGRLEKRSANGGLVFLVDSSGTTRTVAPKAILEVERDVPPDTGPMVPDRLDGETGSAYLARLERTLGSDYARWIGTETGQATLADVAEEDRNARKANGKRSRGATLDEVVGGVLREAEEAIAAADALFDQPKPRSGAKPYAERNQVWRCGTCKRRTRQPECANGHPAVAAPVGKRRETRVGTEG